MAYTDDPMMAFAPIPPGQSGGDAPLGVYDGFGYTMEEPKPAAQQWLEDASQSVNLAKDLEEGERDRIAHTVLQEYDIDHSSMDDWREVMTAGIDLAKLVRKEKTSPWPGSANVRYPLVTVAALQFNARAYPAIVPGDEPVKCKVYGKDKSGKKAARAERVSEHMSWQLMSQIPEWENETDALTAMLPIVGKMLRKVWWDETLQRPCVKLCDPQLMVINNKVKTLATAPRISEDVPLYPYEIMERKRSGVFLDVETQASGVEEDEDAAQVVIEQHRRLDLDEDGYPEPYIVTVHKDSQKLLRIVANFEPEDIIMDGDQVVSVQKRDYYAEYDFFPSVDGSFWSMGLGLLLRDINETINTTINQLLDSGAMSTLGGGWIGAQNFRMKGGAARFRPGEWKQVNFMGDDIRKALVPLPPTAPSPVLFQLLGLLMDAGREISSTKDIMTGEAPRNQTATTTLAMIEQGMAMFNAAYKRLFRGLKEEYGMLARINQMTVSAEEYARFHDIEDAEELPPMGPQGMMAQGSMGVGMPGMGPEGQPGMMPERIDPAKDYDLTDMDIMPVADPKVVTSMQAMSRAQLVLEMADRGALDPMAAARRVLETAHIPDIEELIPEPNQMQQAIEGMQVEHAMAMMEIELKTAQAEIELTLAKVQAEKASAAKDAQEADLAPIELALETSKAKFEDARKRRDQMMQVMKQDDERRLRGMEIQSRNGAASGPAAATGGRAQRPDLQSVLGGVGTPAGTEALGPGAGGGMGGPV